MFIAAGLQTIIPTIVDLEGLEMTKKILKTFCPNGLISYGLGLEKTKKFDKDTYKEKFEKSQMGLIKDIRDETFWIIDSGGYQISIGLLHQKDVPAYIESYKHFLIDNYDLYNEAFTLDIPVTPGMFDTLEDVEKFNYESYTAMLDMPQEVIDKLLFVSHFRTLNNLKVWNYLIYEKDLMKYFKRFSIGGLVVGQNMINSLPINLYTIGMLQIVLYWKDRNDIPDPFRFHILGASNHKSVLFFYLLGEKIKDVYDINIDISYDSSSLFKKFQRARFITYFDEELELSCEISAKSKDINKINPIFKTTEGEIIHREINTMFKLLGIDKQVKGSIYNESETIDNDVKAMVSLLESYEQMKFDKWARKKAKELYNLYKTSNKFYEELLMILTNLNKGGKLTLQTKDLTKTYINSLDYVDKISSINDLEKFMYTYSSITDTEAVSKPPVWEEIL